MQRLSHFLSTPFNSFVLYNVCVLSLNDLLSIQKEFYRTFLWMEMRCRFHQVNALFLLYYEKYHYYYYYYIIVERTISFLSLVYLLDVALQMPINLLNTRRSVNHNGIVGRGTRGAQR